MYIEVKRFDIKLFMMSRI